MKIPLPLLEAQHKFCRLCGTPLRLVPQGVKSWAYHPVTGEPAAILSSLWQCPSWVKVESGQPEHDTFTTDFFPVHVKEDLEDPPTKRAKKKPVTKTAGRKKTAKTRR